MLKPKHIIFILPGFLVSSFLVTGVVLAGSCQSGDAIDCLTQTNHPTMQLIATAINYMSAAVMIIATIMLIVAGIQYITSNGSPEGVKAAKKRITDVLIGLVAFVFLYAFLQWLIPGGNKIF